MLSEELLSKISLVVFRVSQAISFFLGLAPCCIKISTDVSTKIGIHYEFLYSIFGLIYNVLLITGFILIMIFVVPQVIRDFATKTLVMLIIESAAPILENFAAIFVICIYSIYQRRIVAIGNNLSEFDKKYAIKLYENCEMKGFTRGSIYNFLIVLTSILIITGALISSILIYGAVDLLPSMFCMSVNLCFLTQYALITNVLKERARCINETFVRVVEAPIVTEETPSFSDNTPSVTNFSMIRKSWNIIYQISGDISDLYSLPVLVTIFSYSVGCLNSLYFNITAFAFVQKFSLNAQSMSGIFWITIQTYPIVILCESIKRLSAEMEKMAVTIYDVLDTYEQNNVIVRQLKDFSVELLHKKVTFTAYGLFSLDCSLIQTIFGMFVTYLLIMFEFQPAEMAAKIM